MDIQKLISHFLECCSDLELLALESAIKNEQEVRKQERLKFIQDNPLNEQEVLLLAEGAIAKATVSYNYRVKCGLVKAHQLITDLAIKNEQS